MGCIIGGASAIVLWRYGNSNDEPPLGLLAAWFAFWVIIIGLPSLGANAGGTIASTATFVLVVRAIKGQKIKLPDIAMAAAAGVAVAIAFAAFDALTSGSTPSHMGMAAKGIERGNLGFISSIISRKLAMNIAMWSRPGTRAALAIFGAVIVYWVMNREKMLAIVRIPPKMTQGILAMASGGIIALLFNDSGIVTMAFMAAYVAEWWLWDAVTLKAGGLPRLRTRNARTRG